MAVLTATNGNVQLAAGALATIPAGAFTAAVLFRRSGTTTDGFEAILALVSSGSVVTNLGADAAAAPYEVSFGQGGFTRTFGFSTLNDNEAYLFVVVKADGDVTPRGNLYRFDAGSPAWDGWANGSGTVENRADTIDAAWLLNQPGGFPLNGGVFVAAVWDGALAEADITNASTGLHVGVQQWLDFNPVALWRPGETDPVQDESAAGTSDETSSAGVTIAGDDPTGFNMDFGAAEEPGPVWSPHTLTPPGSVSPASRRSPWSGAGISAQQATAVVATTAAVPTSTAVVVKVVPVTCRVVAAATIQATASKVTPTASLMTGVATTTAAPRKVTPTLATTSTVATITSATAKRTPVAATTTAVASVVANLGAPIVAVSARCSAVATLLASAVKRLPATSTTAAAATSSALTVRRQPTAATSTAVAVTTAAAIRRTGAEARVVAVAGTVTQASRRTPVDAGCAAVATVVAQAAQPGQSRPVTARVTAAARIRARTHHVIPRPATGTVARPNTGVIVRPYTGIIERP